MNQPTTGTQVAQDRVDRYRSFGAFGRPAWQSHVQLRAMIRQRLGERCANYFAVPTYEPDAGVIRWTVPATGTVRAWQEMSAEEQAAHALDMEDIRGRLIQFTDELRRKGDGQPGGAAAFASLLEQAMKVPADGHFLFMVGEQPVIAFWGFEDQSGGAVDPTIAQPAPALPPVLPAKAPAVAPAVAPAIAPAVAPAAAPDATPAAVADVRRKRPWWWWVLWLLLALLLLLLLLGLLRGCGPDGRFDMQRAVPGLAGSEDKGSPADGGLGSAPSPGARGDAPQAPGVGGPDAVDPSLPGASGTGVGLAPKGSASVPGGVDAVDPSKPMGSKANPPTDSSMDPKNDPSRGPTDDPKKDTPKDRGKDPAKDPGKEGNAKGDQGQTDPPKPPVDPKNDPSRNPKDYSEKNPLKDPSNDPAKGPGKEGNTKGEKGQADPSQPPLDPNSIKLPDNLKSANKMDFLQGDWKAGEGLVDKATKQPLDMALKFGKDGNGELTLRRPDGTVCSGSVQGRMNGGKLSVEGNQSLHCAGGGSYGAPRIECSKSNNGQTACQGVNRDGSRYYVDMRRQ